LFFPIVIVAKQRCHHLRQHSPLTSSFKLLWRTSEAGSLSFNSYLSVPQWDITEFNQTKTRVTQPRASFITMPLAPLNHPAKLSGFANSHTYVPRDGASDHTRIRCWFLNHLHRDLQQVPGTKGFFNLPYLQGFIIYNSSLSADSVQFASYGLSSLTSHSARPRLVHMIIKVDKHCFEGKAHCTISAEVLGLDNKGNIIFLDDDDDGESETIRPRSEPKELSAGLSISWSYRLDNKHSIEMEEMDFKQVLRLCRRQAKILYSSFGEFRSTEESAEAEKEVGPKFEDGVEDFPVTPGMGDDDGSF
jgi:hypothetical protein